MQFSKIKIKNLLSFENTEFSFKNYNVIVGINNSGKTNLLRILKFLADSNSFAGLGLSQTLKFDSSAPAEISLDVILTDSELQILLKSLFEQEFPPNGYYDELRHVKIVLRWNDLINSSPLPTLVMVLLDNDIWFVTDNERKLIFHVGGIDQNNDDVLDSFLKLNPNAIKNSLQEKSSITANGGMFFQKNFYSELVSNKDVSGFFRHQTRLMFVEIKPHFSFEPSAPRKFASDVFDYMRRKKDAVSTIHFSDLVQHIIKNGFIPIEEIQPDVNNLTESLFTLKVVDEKSYQYLQSAFSNLFNGLSVRVEQDSSNQNSKRIVISENDREFLISDSASGHFAAIHILHTILNQPNRILMLDEPEVNFHPVKIRQLSNTLKQLTTYSNNQIIVISHSPKFVDFRLLDPGDSSKLINTFKVDGKTNVSTLSPDTNIALSPHLFNPEMFFGTCSLLVEGADDEFVMRAISDKFGGIFDKSGISIVSCWGVSHIDPMIQLHKAYSIPYCAMVDKEYAGNEENVTKLSDILETELAKIGWSGSKSELKHDIAYCLIQDILETKDGFDKLKATEIWTAFVKVIETSKSELPDFDSYF